VAKVLSTATSTSGLMAFTMRQISRMSEILRVGLVGVSRKTSFALGCARIAASTFSRLDMSTSTVLMPMRLSTLEHRCSVAP